MLLCAKARLEKLPGNFGILNVAENGFGGVGDAEGNPHKRGDVAYLKCLDSASLASHRFGTAYRSWYLVYC